MISSAINTAIPTPQARGSIRFFDEQTSDLPHLAVLIAVVLVAAFLARYLLPWVLRKLLVRRETKFCPQCFSSRIRPVAGESGSLRSAFLPVFVCKACGKRFHRGRKPPFARCPACRSADLENAARLDGTLRNSLRTLFGMHAYRCPLCSTVFADRRPLRAGPALAEQGQAIQSPGSS